MKKEKIKSHEERYVAHHISFYTDGRLIGKEIIHDKANAKLKRRIRMLVRIKAPGYKICNHSKAPRKNSVSYTIRQEEINGLVEFDEKNFSHQLNGSMEFDENSDWYWKFTKGKKDGPFCPYCWDADECLSRLTPSPEDPSIKRCHKCKYYVKKK